MKKVIKKFYAIPAILFWVAVWHFAAVIVDKSILLPTPKETAEVLFSLVQEKSFWQICALSISNIFSGALIGVAIGIFIGFFSYISDIVRYIFSPILSLLKATPIASIIILFLVWIGRESVPFVISMMMVIPIVSSNVLEGALNINSDLYEVTKIYGFSFSKKWKMLYKPTLLPYVNSALKSSIAMAWKAGIATEVLCTPANTIGKMLNESKLYLEIPTLFAWTFTVIIISLILEKLVVMLSNRLMGKAGR